jgi:hypothetical protein
MQTLFPDLVLGKRTILLTQRAEDIPFDLKHDLHIVYGESISEMKKALETRVRWMISHPRETGPRKDLGIQLYSGGALIQPNSVVAWNIVDGSLFGSIDIHNTGTSVIEPHEFLVGLVTTDCLPYGGRVASLKLPDGRYLHHLNRIDRELFPSGWDSVGFSIYIRGPECSKQIHSMNFRIFTDFGIREIPFDVHPNDVSGSTSGA